MLAENTMIKTIIAANELKKSSIYTFRLWYFKNAQIERSILISQLPKWGNVIKTSRRTWVALHQAARLNLTASATSSLSNDATIICSLSTTMPRLCKVSLFAFTEPARLLPHCSAISCEQNDNTIKVLRFTSTVAVGWQIFKQYSIKSRAYCFLPFHPQVGLATAAKSSWEIW